MIYQRLADLVLLLHLAFILFVVLGGILVLRRPRLAWVHLPAAAWGAYIEFFNRVCPLTPLENHFRRLGGQAGYEGGFIEHYVTAIIYPDGLTRTVQITLGMLVVVVNVVVYAILARRRSHSQPPGIAHPAPMRDSSPPARNDPAAARNDTQSRNR